MILYLDTSSLLKLYADELGSSEIRLEASHARMTATSAVTYVEARAALARKRRLREFSDAQFRHALYDFEAGWPDYVCIDASRQLIRRAGDLAEKHALKGFDAIHLASALSLKEDVSSTIFFSSTDEHLRRSAQSEGFVVGE